MGCFNPCYSTSIESGNREIAVMRLYEELASRTPGATQPGMDDLMDEPFLEDDLIIIDDDGIGERAREEDEVELEVRVEVGRFEEQTQEGTGNAPRGDMRLIVTEDELVAKGLLANGIVTIRPNDRLIQVKNQFGDIRIDLTGAGDRKGMFVFEVRPGETGEGDWTIFLEERREVAR